ncbi:amino acid ABC transporter permease [Nocardioides agariphilus]|uniref:Amino acid ABC transporter permease n=1 Tax=Nocardioides agariphilus TaxID=433664 RepID=A0A930VKR9_9ACTN|nr:amino acid ABC transporter permease [Nocardioides agariphilus]
MLAIAGPLLILFTRGIRDYEVVASALQSPSFKAVCLIAGCVGTVSMFVGTFSYRRMPTRVSRGQAIIGAIAGLEAACLAFVVALFVRGDMATFALNFLNFDGVLDQTGAFLEGMKNTLVITVVSTVCGVALGLVVALLAVSKRAIVRAPARVYVNVVRGTPLLVLLSLLYFGLALGLRINWTPFVAVIVGLTINAGAYCGEIFRAGLQSLERGQMEAARGLGFSYSKSMRLILVPQAVRRVIPPLMNEFIIVTKDTSLIVFIGVSLNKRDLFSVASQGYSHYFNASFYVASALGYLIITLPLIWIVNKAEKRLRSGLVALG